MKKLFIYLVILLTTTSVVLADASVYYCTSTTGGYDEPGKRIISTGEDNFKAKIDFKKNYMLIKGSKLAMPTPLECHGGEHPYHPDSSNTMTCHDNTGYTIFIEKNSLKFAYSSLWGIVSKDSSNKQIIVGYGSCEEF